MKNTIEKIAVIIVSVISIILLVGTILFVGDELSTAYGYDKLIVTTLLIVPIGITATSIFARDEKDK